MKSFREQQELLPQESHLKSNSNPDQTGETSPESDFETDFYEEDEPIEKIQAMVERLERKPDGYTYPREATVRPESVYEQELPAMMTRPVSFDDSDEEFPTTRYVPYEEPQGLDKEEIVDAEIIDPLETKEAMLHTGHIQTPVEVCLEMIEASIARVDRLFESELSHFTQAHALHHLIVARDYITSAKEPEDADE